jgi:hypothetical protein
MNSRDKWHEAYQRKWGFPLPEEYVALAKQRSFDLPQPSGNYTELIDSPYLWVQEMEWRNFPDLLNPNTTGSCVKPGFASFAFAGGGDDWCWYALSVVGGRVPVLYCPRDEVNATYYAPDFITAVYRRILEATVWGFGCDDAKPVERKYLRRWSKELGPLLPKQAAEILRSLVSAPVKRFKYLRFEQKGLITPDELNTLIQRDIAFDLIDKKIKWISVD